jgi:uncharacterized protein (DUF983 family)
MPRTPRPPEDRFPALLLNAMRLRCPVCRKGRIFPRLLKMADHCPECGVRLQREEGYFLGSIYFNYGVTCVGAGAIYFGMLFGLQAPKNAALWTALAFTLLFPLWFWRYARSMWLLLDQYVDPRRPPTSSSGSP